MKRLPLAFACRQDVSRMARIGRDRFCDGCQTRVHTLSERTGIEASALLLLFGKRGLCVQYRVDAHGAIVFRPSGAPKRAGGRLGAPLAAMAIGAAAAAGCGSSTAVAHRASAPRAMIAPTGTTAARGAVARAEALAPADADGDGIADVNDVCPDSAEDFDRFDDQDGCPEPDNDHDRVADRANAPVRPLPLRGGVCTGFVVATERGAATSGGTAVRRGACAGARAGARVRAHRTHHGTTVHALAARGRRVVIGCRGDSRTMRPTGGNPYRTTPAATP